LWVIQISKIEPTPLTWQITKVVSYEQYDGTKYSYFPLESRVQVNGLKR